MKDFLSRAPLAVATAVLLIYGALRIWASPGSTDGEAILAAGFVLLGAWLSVDLLRMYEENKRKSRLSDDNQGSDWLEEKKKDDEADE